MIKDILQTLGVDYKESGHHHCRNGWIQLKNCPFCHSQNYHLGFNLTAGFFVCWKCGGHHVAHTLTLLGLGRREAEAFNKNKQRGPKLGKIQRKGLVEPRGRGPLSFPHLEYLRSRGFDYAQIERVWQVQGIGIASHRLSWRIYIPIFFQGEQVSWTTRTIGEHTEPRYLSASAEQEAMNHRELIYGLDYCRHSVVVVEGPTDAWAIGPGAGATFGIGFTPAQVRQLSNMPNRFICFDSAPDAQRKARELCAQLSVFEGRTENIILDAKDPGSASEKEISLVRKVARLE